MTFTRLTFSILAGVGIALAGCSTSEPVANAPKPRNGIAEYQQIATDAQKSLQTTLKALDQVTAQNHLVSAAASQAFSDQVARLEAESVRVRARSQAMQARGNAYFGSWKENLSRVKDPMIRELAEEHHAELEESFGKIKLASQEARQAFQPFLTGLHKLQTAVEKDPRALASESTQGLVRATGEAGRQVETRLTRIQDELKHMTDLLTPTKSNSKN